MKKLSPLLALLLTGIGASAAELSWTGTANTQWDSSSGWAVSSGTSVSGYPESGDVAIFNGVDGTSGALGSGNTLISGTQSALSMNALNATNIDIIGQNGILNLGSYVRDGSAAAMSFRTSGANSLGLVIGDISQISGVTYFGQNANTQGLTSFVSTGFTSISGGLVGFHMLNSGTAVLNSVSLTGGTLAVRQTTISGTSSVAVASLAATGGSITTSNAGYGILQVASGSFGGAVTVANTGSNTTELVKVGSGTLTMNAATGEALDFDRVTVRQGVLAYVFSGSADQLGDGTAVTIDGGTIDLANRADGIGSFTLASGTLTGAGTGRFNSAGGYNLQSGVINGGLLGAAGSVTKTTAGTVTTTGNHTYTGSTSITGGVLAVTAISNGGANSTLGNNSSAASNLNLDGGVLSYVGASAGSTDRLFTLGTNGGGLDSSGAGAVTFGNTGAAVLSGSNTARTFTLSGSNTGSNIYAGTLGDNGSGATSLTKNGAGKWIITGNHTFTGATTVSAGTLQIGNGGGTGSVAGALVNNGLVQLSRTGSYAMSTVAGAVSGTGTIQVVTSNTVTFGSNMSGFTGMVASNTGGVVNIASLTALGNATILIQGANRLTLDSSLATSSTLALGSLSVTNSYNLSSQLAGTTLMLGGNNGDSSITAGTLTATGGLIKEGTGTFSVTGAGVINFAGGIWLNNGTLSLSTSANPISNGNITFGGGILQYSTITTTDLSGRINAIGSGQNARIDTNSANVTFATGLSGAGGLQKLGSGTLTLSVANTYQAGTTVSAGTLLITNSSAGGTGAVALTGGNLHVNVNSGSGAISNAVIFNNGVSSYVLDRAVGQSLAVYAASSDLAGGIDTAASILAGTAGSARTLTTGFSTIAVATNDSERLSDVFSLAGTSTDLFVLQLDLSTAVDPVYYLAWLSGGEWVNAVDGNTGNNASGLQLGYQGSFAAFQIAYGTTLSAYVGAYGVDAASGSTWAVLNHNSDFAVIPEPSTWALLALGLGTLAWRARRRLVGTR